MMNNLSVIYNTINIKRNKLNWLVVSYRYILFIIIMFNVCFAVTTPDVPVLSQPVNNAINQPLQPQFNWGYTYYAASYKIQICYDQYFSGNFVTEGRDLVAGNFPPWSPSIQLPRQTLYWRVIAYPYQPNNDNDPHSISDVWSFTVNPTAPGAPTLTSPNNGGANVPRSVSIIWTPSTPNSAITYQKYKISTDQNNFLSDRGLSWYLTNISLVDLAPSTTYYWTIGDGNDAGCTWAPIWHFTTENGLGYYEQNRASEYAKAYSNDVLYSGSNYNPIYYSYSLSVLPPNNGACSYYGQPGNCNGDCSKFISQCLRAGGLTLSNITGDDPMDSRGCLPSVKSLYDWINQVYNHDYSGNEVMKNDGTLPTTNPVEVGDIIQFGTTAKPYYHSAIVTKVTDPNSVYGIFLTAHDNDRIDYSLNHYYPVSAGGSYSIAYFHRMKHTIIGIQDIVDVPSGPTQLTYTGGNITYTGHFLDLDASGSRASSWNWQIVFYYDGGQFVAASDNGLPSNQFPPPTDYYNYSTWNKTYSALPTGYNWSRDGNGNIAGTVIVYCLDSDGAGHTNTLAISCTAPARPATPTLSSPSNNATEIGLNPTLTWNSVTGATSYKVQITQDASLNYIDMDLSGITGTTYNLSNLLPNTNYYWRVAATGNWGTSLFSNAWTFKTQVIPTDVVIADQNITASRTFPEIDAHNSITITRTEVFSSVTPVFKAGNVINIQDGTKIDAGGNATITIDPSIR